MWCSEQSVSAVSNCTHEGGHLTSHLASARGKQVVHDSCSLCVAQQKILAPSTTHAVTNNMTLYRAGHVYLELHVLQFLTLNRSLLLEVVGESSILIQSVDHAFAFTRSD